MDSAAKSLFKSLFPIVMMGGGNLWGWGWTQG